MNGAPKKIWKILGKNILRNYAGTVQQNEITITEQKLK